MTALLVAFLAAHGVLHLAIWMPHAADPAKPPPFNPHHSGTLTAAHVPDEAVHALSLGLAAGATAAFLLAATGVALDAGWAAGTAIAAALLGLLLKVLYFHPWLSLGVTLDGAVLVAAATGAF